jgi:rhodanese-related sulfurtransferase
MVRISVSELRDLMLLESKPIVLDARSQSARKLDPRRIPGAVAVNIAAPHLALPAVPPDRDVIVYCS